MSRVQSTMSYWRGLALGVGQGGANLGGAGVEAPSADSVPDAPNAVVGPVINLSALNGRQACVHQVLHIERPAQWPGPPVTLLYGIVCVSDEPKTI